MQGKNVEDWTQTADPEEEAMGKRWDEKSNDLEDLQQNGILWQGVRKGTAYAGSHVKYTYKIH